MKKISITSQLILLSLSVVLLVSTIFTAVSLSGIIRFAEEEVYSRLNSYASIIKTNPNNNYPGQENMDTEFYIVENNEKLSSLLKKEGLNVTVRKEHGHDIDAACGQLRGKMIKKGE